MDIPYAYLSHKSTYRRGFTIVELLIVIVIIAILAALTYVGYTAISNRAIDSTLKSDLTQAAKKLNYDKVDNNDSYPLGPSVPSSIAASDGNTFEYTSDGTSYCLSITSTKSNSLSYHINSSTNSTTPREGVCPGHTGPVAGGGGGGGTTIANNTPIQDVTSSQCAALPVYTGTNNDAIRTVTDSRGGTAKTYRIAKLADNKCWMLDNLKLGSTTGATTLTPADSNVASNFTLPQVSTTGSGDDSGVGNGYDTPYAYGPVPGDTGSGATNYGYLYNWSAATAGETRTSITTGNAAHSICARGWRLPTGGTGGDFAQLDQAFGGAGTSSTSGEPNIAQWQHTGPFKGVFAGYWSMSLYEQGSSGVLWSSAADPVWSTNAFYVYLDASEVYLGDINGRANGLGVRCLLN